MWYESSDNIDYDGTNRYQLVNERGIDDHADDKVRSRATRRVSISNHDINIDNINQSLAFVNTFANKRNDKLQPIMLYEITSFGEGTYKSMTLRELLRYLNEQAVNLDEEFVNRLLAEQSMEEGEQRFSILSSPPPPPSGSPVSSSGKVSNSSSSNPFQYRSDMQLEKVRRTNRRRAAPSGSRIGSSFSGNNAVSTNTNVAPNSITASSGTSSKRRSSIIRIPTSSNLHSSGSIIYDNQSLPASPQPTQNSDESNMNHISDYSIIKSLRLRDLRRLDVSASVLNETAVVVRRHVVIFAMDPIRAVIMADKLLLVLPDGADSLIAILDQYMKEWVDDQQRRTQRMSATASSLQNMRNASATEEGMRNRRKPRRMNVDNKHDFLPDIPFELHAYEALLLTVKEVESQQVHHLSQRIEALLLYYRYGTLIPISVQSELRQIKNDLSIILNRLEGCGQALQYVMEDDEEMALMNLSLLKRKPLLYQYPLTKEILTKHDEIEELIESYTIDFNSISSRISNLKNQIQSSEELVSVRLDIAENQLLFANTALLLLNCCIGFGAYIGGAFGMNLDQTIYILPYDGSFAYVSVGSLVFMIILYLVVFGYLRWAKIIPANYSMTQSTFSHLLSTLSSATEGFIISGRGSGRDRGGAWSSDRESTIHPASSSSSHHLD